MDLWGGGRVEHLFSAARTVDEEHDWSLAFFVIFVFVLPDVQHPTRPNLDVFTNKHSLLLVRVFHLE